MQSRKDVLSYKTTLGKEFKPCSKFFRIAAVQLLKKGLSSEATGCDATNKSHLRRSQITAIQINHRCHFDVLLNSIPCSFNLKRAQVAIIRNPSP